MGRIARPHEEAKIESFRKDPVYAAEYLNAVLADGDQEEVMVTLRYLAQAFGACHYTQVLAAAYRRHQDLAK